MDSVLQQWWLAVAGITQQSKEHNFTP